MYRKLQHESYFYLIFFLVIYIEIDKKKRTEELIKSVTTQPFKINARRTHLRIHIYLLYFKDDKAIELRAQIYTLGPKVNVVFISFKMPCIYNMNIIQFDLYV